MRYVQVVHVSTLYRQQQSRGDISVAVNLGLQMLRKMGASGWTVKIPVCTLLYSIAVEHWKLLCLLLLVY